MKILNFKFTSNSTGDELNFYSPVVAIAYFTKKGYGMHNWKIEITLDTLHRDNTPCSLLMFNFITDNWTPNMEGEI